MQHYQGFEKYANALERRLENAMEIGEDFLPVLSNTFPYLLRKLEWDVSRFNSFLAYSDFYDLDTENDKAGTLFSRTAISFSPEQSPVDALFSWVSDIISQDFYRDFPTCQRIVVYADGIEVYSLPLEELLRIERTAEFSPDMENCFAYRYSLKMSILDVVASRMQKSCCFANRIDVFFAQSAMVHLDSVPELALPSHPEKKRGRKPKASHRKTARYEK